ncbi:acyl-CoA thioesterase [Myceligenerans xiligouense]|uniref:Acyl-CoA thioester hydrolase n=1 Tax=Myceligenerans xiligouense TaxID=253184 RepID=A0A3N4YH27_9MICO|nr:thioesterase family protein [Myceligenerans xiligouense]RPF20409.1 acyl-CoA thioester hydrolase [Myceligenerans xiligouense]
MSQHPPHDAPATSARLPFPLRWNDNDQYGHMNNTVYYEAMDTAVNRWMIREAGLDPQGAVIGLCVASSCQFLRSASFPEDLEVEVGVEKVGRTSLTWAPRILRPGEPDPLATGSFTHVFVDAATRRPVPVPDAVRAAVSRHLTG